MIVDGSKHRLLLSPIEDTYGRTGSMTTAWDTLAGKSIEWTGVHYSKHGDFTDISSHIVAYETDDRYYVTADGKLVGEASYTYKKLDDRMAIVVYRPRRSRRPVGYAVTRERPTGSQAEFDQ
jgi:hypothetical protein